MKMTMIIAAVTTLAAMMSSCSSSLAFRDDSPGGVYKAFVLAGNEAKYADAEAMLCQAAKEAIHSPLASLGGGFKASLDTFTQKGTVEKVEVLKVHLRGDAIATVSARITYTNGSRRDDDTSLVKEGGKWKIGLD